MIAAYDKYKDRSPFWVAMFGRGRRVEPIRHATEFTRDAYWKGATTRYLTLCGKSITARAVRNEAFDLADERSCPECKRTITHWRAAQEGEAL